MKIAIVGTRKCTIEVQEKIEEFINTLAKDTIIVSGGAYGVDSIAECTAAQLGLQRLIFYPDWQKHGKKAGFIRNAEIEKVSDECVAFWDGESKGTKHTISLFKKAKKKVTIIQI